MVMIDSPDGGHGDAAVYLLGALDVPARARFEAHAAVCAECRRQIAQLQHVADALALASPQVDPPPLLRERLLARAAAIPAASAGPTAAWPSPPVAAMHRPWWRPERFATVLAAASIAIALASGGFAFAMHQELKQTATVAAQLGETLAIMYQPGVVPRVLEGTSAAPRAKGKVYLAPDRTHAVVMAYDLPRLNRNEAYQCWLTNDEEKRFSGGVFAVDETGHGQWLVRAPTALYRFRTLGVTREPARGSHDPTGPRVLGGSL